MSSLLCEVGVISIFAHEVRILIDAKATCCHCYVRGVGGISLSTHIKRILIDTKANVVIAKSEGAVYLLLEQESL